MVCDISQSENKNNTMRNLKPREANFLVQRHKANYKASTEPDSKSPNPQCRVLGPQYTVLEVSGQAV